MTEKATAVLYWGRLVREQIGRPHLTLQHVRRRWTRFWRKCPTRAEEVDTAQLVGNDRPVGKKYVINSKTKL
eukprot:4351316-Amphidinium_carterae.1